MKVPAENQVHIVYDSREDYDNRSESPEHSGIPAIPVVFPARRLHHHQEQQGGYTSDDSSLGMGTKLNYSPSRRRIQAKKERIIWA